MAESKRSKKNEKVSEASALNDLLNRTTTMMQAIDDVDVQPDEMSPAIAKEQDNILYCVYAQLEEMEECIKMRLAV